MTVLRIPSHRQIANIEQALRDLPPRRRGTSNPPVDITVGEVLGVITARQTLAPNRGLYTVQVKRSVDESGAYVDDGPVVENVLSDLEVGNTATHILNGQQALEFDNGILEMDLLKVGTPIRMRQIGRRWFILDRVNGTTPNCGGALPSSSTSSSTSSSSSEEPPTTETDTESLTTTSSAPPTTESTSGDITDTTFTPTSTETSSSPPPTLDSSEIDPGTSTDDPTPTVGTTPSTSSGPTATGVTG